MDKNQLWQTILGELELIVSQANFMTWFKNTRIASIEENNGLVVIAVPNSFTERWLRSKYHKNILEIIQNITDGKLKNIVYQIETFPLTKQTVFSSAVQVIKESINLYDFNPNYTFEKFIVGKGNELAHAASQAVVKNPGEKYNPLFIYGGVGLGKTHLLQAICQATLKQKPKLKFLYTNAEKFTNDFVEAIKAGLMTKFRKKYRSLEMLLVDDVQFFKGKEGTQEEFFYTFNTLYEKEYQIVLSSDRLPKAIPSLEQRLISRFEMGLIADIAPPDYETRMAILKAKSAERGQVLDQEILDYIATHILNNVREIEGALNTLIAHYELYHQPVTLDLAKEILARSIVKPAHGSLQIREIVNAVSDFYGLRVSEMISVSRKKETTLPRQVAAYLLREILETSFPAIGKELGGRDHTTVMYSYEKIKKEMEAGGKIKEQINLIKKKLNLV